MKIIKYLLITIIIFSCEENSLTKWVNYDESTELTESQENECNAEKAMFFLYRVY